MNSLISPFVPDKQLSADEPGSPFLRKSLGARWGLLLTFSLRVCSCRRVQVKQGAEEGAELTCCVIIRGCMSRYHGNQMF